MKPKVYFVPVRNGESPQSIAEKVEALVTTAGVREIVEPNELVAIKMHFGEQNNNTHVRPEYVRPVVRVVKAARGKPFLTDTNVLYKSQRNNAVDHLQLAYTHGFTLERVEAPVVILDGLRGNQEMEIEIPGRIYERVSLAAGLALADGLIGVTHITGHMATGLGGTLKNLGMGLASRMGKLRQHSVSKPWIEARLCTACAICIRWCPEDAILMRGSVAWIDPDRCIGCGECLAVCRFDAVRHDWRVESAELQRRVAEHALGAVKEKNGKAAFLNFVISVTKDCDCLNRPQQPVIPDVGVLASRDPVAVDAAALQLVADTTGKDLAQFTYPHINNRVQLQHGESIGLGSMNYDLIEM